MRCNQLQLHREKDFCSNNKGLRPFALVKERNPALRLIPADRSFAPAFVLAYYTRKCIRNWGSNYIRCRKSFLLHATIKGCALLPCIAITLQQIFFALQTISSLHFKIFSCNYMQHNFICSANLLDVFWM